MLYNDQLSSDVRGEHEIIPPMVHTHMRKPSGSVGLIGGIHLLITPTAPLIAASTKSQVTL